MCGPQVAATAAAASLHRPCRPCRRPLPAAPTASRAGWSSARPAPSAASGGPAAALSRCAPASRPAQEDAHQPCPAPDPCAATPYKAWCVFAHAPAPRCVQAPVRFACKGDGEDCSGGWVCCNQAMKCVQSQEYSTKYICAVRRCFPPVNACTCVWLAVCRVPRPPPGPGRACSSSFARWPACPAKPRPWLPLSAAHLCAAAPAAGPVLAPIMEQWCSRPSPSLRLPPHPLLLCWLQSCVPDGATCDFWGDKSLPKCCGNSYCAFNDDFPVCLPSRRK